MVIQHNMTSANANRQIGITTGLLAKSTEKLSSGFRINRASDDAAGLSISEKLRNQIRGLDRGTQNTQEGISLVQTADGALNEVSEILQRISELCVQAANDINDDIDRDAIQKEINQLTEEIDRISDTTTFNDRPLLKVENLVGIDGGNYGAAVMSDEVNIPKVGTKYGKALDFSRINTTNKSELIGKSFQVTCTESCSQTFTFKFTDGDTSKIDLKGTSLEETIGINDDSLRKGSDIVKRIYDLAVSMQSALEKDGDIKDATYIGHANGIAKDGAKIVMYSISRKPPHYTDYYSGMGLVKAAELEGLNEIINIQVGANEEESIQINLTTINKNKLGLSDLSVNSYKNAGQSITKTQNAI